MARQEGVLGIRFCKKVKELPRAQRSWNISKGRAKERKEGFRGVCVCVRDGG